MWLAAPPHFVKIARAICDFAGLRLDALPPLRYASLRHGALAAPHQNQPTNNERNQSVSQRRTEAPKGRRLGKEGAREANRKRKNTKQENSGRAYRLLENRRKAKAR